MPIPLVILRVIICFYVSSIWPAALISRARHYRCVSLVKRFRRCLFVFLFAQRLSERQVC